MEILSSFLLKVSYEDGQIISPGIVPVFNNSNEEVMLTSLFCKYVFNNFRSLDYVNSILKRAHGTYENPSCVKKFDINLHNILIAYF